MKTFVGLIGTTPKETFRLPKRLSRRRFSWKLHKVIQTIPRRSVTSPPGIASIKLKKMPEICDQHLQKWTNGHQIKGWRNLQLQIILCYFLDLRGIWCNLNSMQRSVYGSPSVSQALNHIRSCSITNRTPCSDRLLLHLPPMKISTFGDFRELQTFQFQGSTGHICARRLGSIPGPVQRLASEISSLHVGWCTTPVAE